MSGEIKISGLQIKSLEKAKKLSEALSIIEEECGIRCVKITLEKMFICPWIDLEKLDATEMEKLVCEIIKKIS